MRLILASERCDSPRRSSIVPNKVRRVSKVEPTGSGLRWSERVLSCPSGRRSPLVWGPRHRWAWQRSLWPDLRRWERDGACA